MVTVDLVNSTWHPASHSCPTERRGCGAREGTICPWRAAGGSPGMSRSAVAELCMLFPSGLRMEMMGALVLVLHTGVEVVKKWEVHPESAIAITGGLFWAG